MTLAGIGCKFDDPLEKWEECIRVNLHAVMNLCKLVTPHLTKKERGAIINIASIAGRIPLPGFAPCMQIFIVPLFSK